MEYGPDEVGYVADQQSSAYIGFSRRQVRMKQTDVPSLENGNRVLYSLDEKGRVTEITLDLANLAEELNG